MCNDKAAAFCEPCMPYQSTGVVDIAGLAQHLPSQTQHTGDNRFVTYVQRGALLGRPVLAASMTQAQLRAA